MALRKVGRPGTPRVPQPVGGAPQISSGGAMPEGALGPGIAQMLRDIPMGNAQGLMQLFQQRLAQGTGPGVPQGFADGGFIRGTDPLFPETAFPITPTQPPAPTRPNDPLALRAKRAAAMFRPQAVTPDLVGTRQQARERFGEAPNYAAAINEILGKPKSKQEIMDEIGELEEAREDARSQSWLNLAQFGLNLASQPGSFGFLASVAEAAKDPLSNQQQLMANLSKEEREVGRLAAQIKMQDEEVRRGLQIDATMRGLDAQEGERQALIGAALQEELMGTESLNKLNADEAQMAGSFYLQMLKEFGSDQDSRRDMNMALNSIMEKAKELGYDNFTINDAMAVLPRVGKGMWSQMSMDAKVRDLVGQLITDRMVGLQNKAPSTIDPNASEFQGVDPAAEAAKPLKERVSWLLKDREEEWNSLAPTNRIALLRDARDSASKSMQDIRERHYEIDPDGMFAVYDEAAGLIHQLTAKGFRNALASEYGMDMRALDILSDREVMNIAHDLGKNFQDVTVPGISIIDKIIAESPVYFLNDADAKRMRGALQSIVNIELLNRSGAAVTTQEFNRFKNEFSGKILDTQLDVVNALNRYGRVKQSVFDEHITGGFGNKYKDWVIEEGLVPTHQQLPIGPDGTLIPEYDKVPEFVDTPAGRIESFESYLKRALAENPEIKKMTPRQMNYILQGYRSTYFGN